MRMPPKVLPTCDADTSLHCFSKALVNHGHGHMHILPSGSDNCSHVSGFCIPKACGCGCPRCKCSLHRSCTEHQYYTCTPKATDVSHSISRAPTIGEAGARMPAYVRQPAISAELCEYFSDFSYSGGVSSPECCRSLLPRVLSIEGVPAASPVLVPCMCTHVSTLVLICIARRMLKSHLPYPEEQTKVSTK